jgi:hypothetical protein
MKQSQILLTITIAVFLLFLILSFYSIKALMISAVLFLFSFSLFIVSVYRESSKE